MEIFPKWLKSHLAKRDPGSQPLEVLFRLTRINQSQIVTSL